MVSVRALGLGVLMGFVLSRIGFSSWDDVHGMFMLSDGRLIVAFAVATIVLMLAWPVLDLLRSRPLVRPLRPVRRGTLLGAMLFGAGWSLTGACPSAALVQVGEGQAAALATVLGILVGDFAFSWANQRVLRWDTDRCSRD